MSKTVKIPGLRDLLAWLAPLCKSVAAGSVQLADGVQVQLPEEIEVSFTPTADPDVIRLEFAGVSASIDRRSLLGLIHVHATEPVTYADVGPRSIETQVSLFRIVAVDEGN